MADVIMVMSLTPANTFSFLFIVQCMVNGDACEGNPTLPSAILCIYQSIVYEEAHAYCFKWRK